MRRVSILWRFFVLLGSLGAVLLATAPMYAATGPLPAYLARRGDTHSLVMRRAGGAYYREITLPADFDAAGRYSISPNGRWLAYYTGFMSLPGEGPSAGLTLHILDLETGDPLRFFPLASGDIPAKVAETARLLQERDPSLAEVVDLPEAVYMALRSGLEVSAWSPDGTRFAFGGSLDGPTSDLYLYTPAGDSLSRLTDGIEQINELRWSPDGKWIWHNTVSFGYCQVCDGHKYAAAADGSTVLTLPGDEIDRHLGWIGPTTYLETDQANGPGDFDLRLVDVTGDASRQLWPGMHQAFALDLARNRLAVTGAITATGWVFPQETFLVALTTGDTALVGDPSRVTGADAELLDALAQAGRYTCAAQNPIVRPCSDSPWSPTAPDGSATVDMEGALLSTTGEQLLPPEPALSGGAAYWRPDGAGYFVVNGRTLSYRDRETGQVTALDEGVTGVQWLTAAVVNVDPDPAQQGSTMSGSPKDVAYALREAQAVQLAHLAQAPIQPPDLPGLPLLLGREAVLTTQRPVFDLIPAPYVLPQAEDALRRVVEQAPPWIGEFPADGPLSSLRSLDLSHDGAWIATGHSDGAVRLWEMKSGRLARTLSAEAGGVQQVVFSPSGDYLAAAAESGIVHIWDMADWDRAASYNGRYRSATAMIWEPEGLEPEGNVLLIANGDDPVQRLEVFETPTVFLDRPAKQLAFSADGSRMAAALRPVYPVEPGGAPLPTQPPPAPPILLRDLTTGQELELPDPAGTTYILAFSPDGRFLVSGSAYELRVWDAGDGTLLHTLALSDFPNGWAFTTDSRLAVLSRRFGVTSVDVAAGRILHSLPVDANQLGRLDYDAARGRLVSADLFGRPVLLDPETGSLEYPFDNPEARLVVAHPTKPLVLTAGGQVIEVRDLDTGATLHTLTGLNALVSALAFSADGSQVIAGDTSGMIAVWETDSGTLLRTFGVHGGSVITLQPAGHDFLVSAGRDDQVIIWETEGWSERARLDFPTELLAVAAGSDGQIAVATRDGRLQRFDAATAEPLDELDDTSSATRGRIIGLRYSPDASRLAVAAEQSPVVLWDTAVGEIRHTLPLTNPYLPFGLAFSPDGSTLATGPSYAHPLSFWDVASGKLMRTVPTVAASAFDATTSLAFDAGGTRLLVADQDQVVRIYSLTPTRSLRTLTGHGGSVWEAAFSPNGRFLLTGSEDGSMRLWDWQTGQADLRYPDTPERVFGVAYSPTGDTVAAVGIDGAVYVYLSGGAPQTVLTGHTSWVDEVAYSPDGLSIATSGDDKTVRVWDWRRGIERWRVEDLPSAPGALVYSPDGSLLAGAAGGFANAAIYLWNAATGAEVATLTGHAAYGVGLAFSPDGVYLASAGWDNSAKLWDIAGGQEVFTMEGHSASLTDIAFSPDGTRIATVAEDFTLRLWDAATGAALERMDMPRSLPGSVNFSRGGHALVTTHWDGKVRTWSADPSDAGVEALLLTAAARTPRAVAEFSGPERRLYGIDAFVAAYPLSASGNINVRPDTTVRSLVVLPGEPETLVALSDQQFLLRSTDRGATWEILDRLPLTLTVNSLGLPARAADPLLPATDQGLYRFNADRTLTQLGAEPLIGVSFSHTNPSELWAIRRDTVIKSEDGGATWGAAGNDLRAHALLAPLIMAPDNNNPQFVLGYGAAAPGIHVWRGAANGFWKEPPGLPVLPLGLANAFGAAWDAGNHVLYLGGRLGELYAVDHADAPDENALTANVAHDFGKEGRPAPLAVGQGPTLYVMVYGPFEPRFLRGVWDGTAWNWQALRLPMDAAG